MSATKLAVVVGGLVLLCLGLTFGQQEELEFAPYDLPLVSPHAVPDGGNFYSAAHEDWPPLPFFPFKDKEEADLVPVYFLSGPQGGGAWGHYLFDDRAVVAAEMLVKAAALESGGGMMTMNGLEFPGEDETNGTGGGTWEYTPIVYGSNDLWLEIISESVTNGTANLIIHNPEDLVTNSPVWDIYATTNLNLDFPGLNGTNWTWVLRTDPGQTNVTVPLLSDYQCYYRLGDTNDLDGDGLTDIFEVLVSHSDPSLTDSDSDGMDDFYEWVHFGTMAQGATDDFDGDGVGNLDEKDAGLNPSFGDTDGDGIIDQLFRVQIRSPQ